MKKVKKLLFFGLMTGIILIAFGCSLFTGKEKVEINKGSFTIEKDKVTELDVEVKMGAGELTVSGGTENWVDGRFDTNMKDLEPVVTYEDKNKIGSVVIEQQDKQDLRLSKIKNEWNLALSEDIPMNLSVMTGASSAKLDLQQLQLNKLDIKAGVGELNLDLSDDWKKGFKVSIQTGVGETTIILPSDIGVEIKTQKGIGRIQGDDLVAKGNGVYVNEAFENADVIIEMNVDMGVGQVTFELDNK